MVIPEKAIGGGTVEKVDESIMIEILLKLDLETLCTAACVSRSFRTSVSQTLLLFPNLHLSPEFSPDSRFVGQIIGRMGALKSIKLDCLRLDDDSVALFLGETLRELKLLKASLLTYHILGAVGRSCPNLRVFVLELAANYSSEDFNDELVQLLTGCLNLESLCIKIRGMEFNANTFCSIGLLPKSVKVLKLQPISERNAVQMINKFREDIDFSKSTTKCGIPFWPLPSSFSIQCLSLVLDIISDELVIMISRCLPSLVELDLEDRPTSEPMLPYDLTNNGLQFLCLLKHLTSLSLMRSRQNSPVYFKRINNVGFFLLAEGCRNLQSVRLGGLSKVSDAGFTSILQSCSKLKNFEVRNAMLLSDLALIGILGDPCSLVELRLLSCTLLTSAVVEDITSNSKLEVLDLSGCRSIADACLVSVSCLSTLNTLDLSGADVTDSGLADFGKGNSPIARLCLRGCKRVTDKGITLLLEGGGAIRKTLSALDVGYIAGISDIAIQTIAEVTVALTELCLRYCYNVTDGSIRALASERLYQNRRKLIRKLDLCHCLGLSVESLELLKNPSFRGLQWLGVGLTPLISKGNVGLAEICNGRPCLTICSEACEVGCRDGWQFHYSTKG